jgi:hypothetical protein
MTPEDRDVIDEMNNYGGSFVRALARAFEYADADNFARLKAAFPDYWARYAEMADKARNNSPLK